MEILITPVLTAFADIISPDKVPLLIAVVVTAGIILFTTRQHQKGKPFVIREIAGLKAIGDAVGRATEMNRPVLFTPGWGGDVQRPTTIASLNLLSHLTEQVASHDCELLFATHDPIILAVAQEVVREGYSRAGYADRFRPEGMQYVSSSQFGYAAAVDGIIVRRRPASIFLLGTFEAESLILAETGHSTGAIQIAGTDSTIQLAFFIVACDYTLIGEELFVASAYLSNDRAVLASVRAQDMLKVLLGILLLIGTLFATLNLSAGLQMPAWWKF